MDEMYSERATAAEPSCLTSSVFTFNDQRSALVPEVPYTRPCGVSGEHDRTWGTLVGVISLVRGSYMHFSQNTRPVEGEKISVRVGPPSATFNILRFFRSKAKNCTFWFFASRPGAV